MPLDRTGSPTPLRARRYSTWLLAIALGLVCAVSLQRSFALVDQRAQEADARTRDELSRFGEAQGRAVETQVARVLRTAVRVRQGGGDVDLGASGYLIDAYLWSAAAPEGPVLWPPLPVAFQDHEVVAQTDCLREGQNRVYVGQHVEGAKAFDTCPDMPIDVRVLAGVLAAREWLGLGRPELALESLSPPDLPYGAPLFLAAVKGVPLHRAIDQREEAITALHRLRRSEEADALALALLDELLTLPAPFLANTLSAADRRMREHPGEAPPHWAPLRAQADRRKAVWLAMETGRRALISAAAAAAPIGKISGPEEMTPPDPSGRPGMLLYWTRVDKDVLGAVIVDGGALLDHLLADAISAAPPNAQAVIQNARNEPLYPVLAQKTDVRQVTVGLGPLFPELRLSRVESSAQADAFAQGLLISQLLPILLALILGGLAIVVHTRADERLRELYERQQAFITRVTHELKTPLAGIRVMAETIAMGAADDVATNRIFLNRILKETEKLGARIDEVLTAARRPEIKSLVSVLPHELAASVCDTWRPRFEAAGVTLEVELRPCAAIPIDPALVRDALSNLLDNALKYQRVGIHGLVRVRTQEVGSWCILEVADNGLGVPARLRKKVFERFMRVEGPGRGKTGGHGLGLSFVAETAEAHGGKVECLDGIDGGARFRLKLKSRP
jgi:signal transduction histidine kinase